MNTDKHGLDFTGLVTAIRDVHAHLAAQAGKAVCISLTLRNWAIGCYIREYEQEGRDRADYGKNLLQTLAISLKDDLDKCYTGRYLRLCRQLYDVYPQIRKSLISRFDVAEKGKSLISDLPEQSVLDGHLAVSEPATHPVVQAATAKVAALHRSNPMRHVGYIITLVKNAQPDIPQTSQR